MSDPLSIAGLVLSITGLVSSLQSYFESVRSVRDDIRRLSHELFALKGVFEFVQSLPHPQPGISAQLKAVVAGTDSTLTLLSSELKPALLKKRSPFESLAWPFRKPDVDKHVTTLERAKTLVIMLVMGDTAELVSAVQQELAHLSEIVEGDIAHRRGEAVSREIDDLISKLAKTDPSKDQLRIEQSRTPGTGEWFFDDEFRTWAFGHGKQPLWWITGKCRCSIAPELASTDCRALKRHNLTVLALTHSRFREDNALVCKLP